MPALSALDKTYRSEALNHCSSDAMTRWSLVWSTNSILASLVWALWTMSSPTICLRLLSMNHSNGYSRFFAATIALVCEISRDGSETKPVSKQKKMFYFVCLRKCTDQAEWSEDNEECVNHERRGNRDINSSEQRRL